MKLQEEGMSIRWLAVANGLILSIAVAACGDPPPPPPPAPPATVAAVLEREITEWDEFTGRMQAVNAVEIRPRVSGYIRRIAFNEGNSVRKGQLLVEIDPRPYQADLARAEAELERARTTAALAGREVERAQRLVAVQAISREEFDTRTSAHASGDAGVRAAEAAVATARLNLEWTEVRSPISGRVSRAEVTAGNLVQAGPPDATLLTTVVSLDPIYVYFESDEQTYLKYTALARNGSRPSSRDNRSPVELGLANEEGFPHKGYIDFVDNQLNPDAGTIRLRAVFANRNHEFTPGLFARIRLVGSGKYPATLVLDRAIGTDQDKKFVLVLKPDSTVDYRPVQLGRLMDEGLRVITSGLKPGERIVINGMQRAQPGTKVTPKLAEMAAYSSAQADSSAQARP
jgi:multidrug efflux system membrane fusion protein